MSRSTVLTVTIGLALVGGLVSAHIFGARSASQDMSRLTESARAGDIIFHPSASSQAEALREATGSDYTHVGLLFEHDGALQVLEAVEPVRWTELQAWIDRSADGRVVLARPTQPMSSDQVARVQTAAEAYIGRHYDLLFEWSDDSIYCSELVYKSYEQALGWQLGALQTFGDLALTGPAVSALIEARIEGNVDTTESVVTPVSVLLDDDLEVVFSNDPAVAVTTL